MTNLIVHKRIFLVIRRDHDADIILDGFRTRIDAMQMAAECASREAQYDVTELNLQDLPINPTLM